MNILVSSSDVLNEIIIHGSAIWIDNLSLDYGGIGITDLELNKNFSVYPDETMDNLIVSLNFDTIKKTSISLYSINGKLLYQSEKNINSSLETINISDYATGIYIVDVRTSDGNRFTQKVNIH